MLARPFFVANWKMNMLSRDAGRYVLEFRRLYKVAESGLDDTVLAPPFTLLPVVRDELGGLPGVLLAAQNVHAEDFGAHTGEVSAPMLRELGVSFAIVGHSERRALYGETDAWVSKRALNALKHGIRPVICIGETLGEFEAKRTKEVLTKQLHGVLEHIPDEHAKTIILAYEPVWAIGTGRAATPDDIAAASEHIITTVQKRFGPAVDKVRLLYGGSTSPENIKEIVKVPGIGGALVGGASLNPQTFWSLIENARSVAAKS